MINTPTFAACVAALLVIGMSIMFFIRSYVNDLTASGKLADMNTKMAVMKATSGSSRSLVAISSFSNLLSLYAKPMLSSLTDLQAALRLQVAECFLHRTTLEHAASGRSTADSAWPSFLFAFGLAELCAWMEIFRINQHTIDGSEHMEDVLYVVEDIKRVLSGNNAISGAQSEEDQRPDEYDASSHILRLNQAEIQAIGSVMLVYKTDEETQLAFRVPLAIDEFLRIVSAQAPDMDAPYQLQYEWAQSFDNKLQVVCSPLLDEVSALAMQGPESAPKKRLALLQVLICKLIDMLDPAIPWDMGPAYDPGEQRRLVLRDDRLTPLVASLSTPQLEWLRQRPYFRADTNICFPGFRTDLSHLTQEERDVHAGLWPGACPPCEPRRRPPQWRRDNPQPTQLPPAASGTAFHGHSSKSFTGKSRMTFRAVSLNRSGRHNVPVA